MPRVARIAPGGLVYHVLNRGVGRVRLFSKEKDFAAFEDLLEETLESRPMRVCAYCLMPNHWHLLLWPKQDGDLAAFMQQLTTKHVRRWQLHRGKVGYGHVYQGRYKSFPVAEEEHFYQVVRYGNAMPCGRNWSSGRRRGGGRASGDGPTARPTGGDGWAVGRCQNRRVGVRLSTSPKRMPSWKRSVAACLAGSPMEVSLGSSKRRNDSDWNRPSGLRTARERPRRSERK